MALLQYRCSVFPGRFAGYSAEQFGEMLYIGDPDLFCNPGDRDRGLDQHHFDSCGMLISALHKEEGEEKLHLLMVDPHIPAGAKMY